LVNSKRGKVLNSWTSFLCGRCLKAVRCIRSLLSPRSKNVRFGDLIRGMVVFSKHMLKGLMTFLLTKLCSCIYDSYVKSMIRSECSDQSITLHHVYRYRTTMERLFMFTWFSINTVIICISSDLLHFFLHDQCVW